MAKAKTEAATAPAAAPAPAALAQATALAKIDPRAGLTVADGATNYTIVSLGTMGGDMAEAMRDNLGGTQLSAFDFERMKVPAGGGLAWQSIDGDTGKVAVETAVEGIIVAWNDQKAYWAQGLDEQGATQGPPQCFSLDTVKGIGNPGVACAGCPFNRFGSAKGGKGKGKACKDWRAVFFVREGDVLPRLLPVPPTSIKPMKQYFIRLAARGVPYWRAVTRFTLAPAKNSAGVAYAQIVPELVGIVPDEIAGNVRQYHQTIKGQLSKASIPARAEDFAAGEAGEVIDPSTGEVIEGGEPAAPAGNVDRAAAVV